MYQDIIVSTLARMSEHQMGIINECIDRGNGTLFVPMGSGKSIMSMLVSLLLCENDADTILVIAAKGLIANWIEDFVKFFGKNISYEIYHKDFVKNMDSWVPTAKFVFTTPDTLSKYYKQYNVRNNFVYEVIPEEFGPRVTWYRPADNPIFSPEMRGGAYLYSHKWSSMILDEIQGYTNVTTIKCQSIAAISAYHRWPLSGTPIAEPKIPRILGYFLILNVGPKNLPDTRAMVQGDEFEGLLSTTIHRDDNPDFVKPHINTFMVTHELLPEESLIYTNIRNIVNELNAKVKELERQGNMEDARLFRSYILVCISYLRQSVISTLIPITNVVLDMADFNNKSELSKVFMRSLEKLRLDVWLNDIDSICSSRIRAICEQLKLNSDRKIIIFSSYRQSLDLLSLYIPDNRPQFSLLSKQNITKRGETLNNFKASHNGILLTSYDLGSNGLNIQACDTAFMMDLWWNCSKTEQAIARIFRFGQESKVVNVYYFTANSGIENAILKLQLSKKNIINEVMVGKIKSEVHKLSIDAVIKLINQNVNTDILLDIISKKK